MAKDVGLVLERLHRLASVGTMAAGMAHEIKNALVPVRTFVELLVKQHPQAELAGVVDRELHRIDSLVSQMLKCAGPDKPMFTPVRLHEVVEHSLGLLQFQMERKGIRVKCELSAATDWIGGDRYQLEQALTNILINALEAMSAGGELRLETDLVPPGSAEHTLTDFSEVPLLRLRISDTGVGIPPENLSRLFETFFTTKPNGTGLGLTITRRIIREHGGAITAQSEPNKGTTFSVYLPGITGPAV